MGHMSGVDREKAMIGIFVPDVLPISLEHYDALHGSSSV